MSEPMDRWVSAEQVGAVTVARLLPRTVADQPVIQGVRQELLRLAEEPEGSRLLIDFGEVTQFGSAFLAVLLELNRKFKTSGGRLALCWLNPHLRQVFEVTRLDKTLNIYDDEESALDSF
jgi:anti-anti-sigma factor